MTILSERKRNFKLESETGVLICPVLQAGLNYGALLSYQQPRLRHCVLSENGFAEGIDFFFFFFRNLKWISL